MEWNATIADPDELVRLGWAQALGSDWTVALDRERAILTMKHRDGAWFRAVSDEKIDRIGFGNVVSMAKQAADLHDGQLLFQFDKRTSAGEVRCAGRVLTEGGGVLAGMEW